jgi:hypothetical protein
MEEAYKVDARERRGGRWLDDHRTADSDRWHDLMDDEIQRVIER